MNRLSPKKLLLTKWTAKFPLQKNKHFIVTKVIPPELPSEQILYVEIEAVYSKKIHRIGWRDLQDESKWIQGWK
jgi:tryptophan-rich hypothetical protein